MLAEVNNVKSAIKAWRGKRFAYTQYALSPDILINFSSSLHRFLMRKIKKDQIQTFETKES